MKRKSVLKTAAAVALAVAALVLVFAPACSFSDGCSAGENGGASDDALAGIDDALAGIEDKPEENITRIIDFAEVGALPAEGWQTANWQNDPELFGCRWSYDNVWVDNDGKLRLEIREPAEGDYTGGEFRTTAEYGYGYYSVSMKPMKADGVISSFFTYTNNPRWDEIDIEFLGDDTTKVQFNYYTDGKGGHEYVYRLGFDASEEYHTYGFEWLKDCIIWYVDGKPVYKAEAEIPVYEQQIMMNLWNIDENGPSDWAGVYKGDLGTAYYEWVGFDAAE